MERGFDRDYVIDYNLGEITFNNHIVITQFTIIRVDFEYAEQFYSRSNLSAFQSISYFPASICMTGRVTKLRVSSACLIDYASKLVNSAAQTILIIFDFACFVSFFVCFA